MARKPLSGDGHSALVSSSALEATGALGASMKQLNAATAQFGSTLSKAFASGIAQGKSFDEILKGLGQKLLELSLRAAFKPLEGLMKGVMGSLTGAVSSLFSAGTQSLFGSASSLFGGGGGKAVSSMGSLFGGGASFAQGAPVTVNMAVTTPDAESFNRSEAQVSAALARAVSRGQRSL